MQRLLARIGRMPVSVLIYKCLTDNIMQLVYAFNVECDYYPNHGTKSISYTLITNSMFLYTHSQYTIL